MNVSNQDTIRVFNQGDINRAGIKRTIRGSNRGVIRAFNLSDIIPAGAAAFLAAEVDSIQVAADSIQVDSDRDAIAAILDSKFYSTPCFR